MNRPLRAVLRMVLPPEDREVLMPELESLYESRRRRRGRIRAELWAVRTAAGFVTRLGRDRFAGGVGRRSVDVRRALRGVARRPGWALAMVTTLGLGAGGVVTVYAVAHEVLLRPIPGVADAASLVEVRLRDRESERPSFPISHGDLEAFRALPELTHLEARVPLEVNLAPGEGTPVRARADAVTPGWFEALGVTPAAGRLPTAGLSVDEATAALEVVVSWSLARRLADHPTGAVGRRVRINGLDASVAGVTPAGFRGVELPAVTDVWIPAGALPVLEPSTDPAVFQGQWGVWPRMVGRLAPGATVEAAEAALDRLLVERREAEASWAFLSVNFEMEVLAGLGPDPGIRREVTRTLGLLAGASSLLLILATANVAGLSLTRAVSRESRRRVQRALGAGPGHLTAEVVTEHLVLGVCGAVVAVGGAAGAAQLLEGVRLDQSGAALAGLSVGPRATALALCAALAMALAAAVAPAALAARSSASRPLRGEGPSAQRLRRGFALAQLAASVVLLVGAGLLTRTVGRMAQVDPGFETRDVLAFDFDPSRLGLDDGEAARLVEELAAALSRAPSVEAAGIAFPSPVWGAFLTAHVRPADEPEAEGLVGAHLQVAGDLLGAMGVEVVAGRDFTAAERAGDPTLPGVVLLSMDAAEALFPQRPPASVVGAKVKAAGADDPLEIVGLVPALRRRGPRTEPPPSIIRPWGQSRFNDVASAWVRARPGAWNDLAGTVRRVASDVRPDLPLFDFRSVEAQVDRLVADTRVVAGLAAVTSILGLTLSALGLYGLLAWAVTSRTREIGVRAALGAPAGSLVRQFVAQGLGLAVVGLLPGVAGALVFARLLEARLFEVGTLDPVAWIAGVGLLLAVAALASWIPARRAARVDVARTLTSD